jgi:uncharacterized protein with FMN-binding domain
MRRALPVLFATVAALVLLLSFHTSPESAAVTSPISGSSPVAGGSPTGSSTTTAAGAGPSPTPAAGSSTATTPSTIAAVRQYTGSAVTNRYGTVQVRITVRGSALTDVVALQLPGDRAHSQRLSAEAGPILRSEALRAQAARVDVVSGATFTSESYAQSLQSALDQANLGR